MDVSLFLQLVLQEGLPLAVQIHQWYTQDKSRPVTTDDINILLTLQKYRSVDALAAQGIKIVDGLVVPI